MLKNVQRVLLIPIIVGMFLVFTAPPIFAAEFTVRYGTPGELNDSTSGGAKWFLDEIKKRTNGRIEGKLFPSSQLGNNVQMIEQLQLGTLEFTAGAVAFLSGAYPPVTLFDIPFVFPDNPDILRKVLLKGKASQWMLDDMARVGLKGLAFHSNSYKQFTSNTPITKLEDMKGLKFRSMASPILLEQFKALGANALPIPWAETYTALQTGVAEGQENPFWAIYTMRFYEVQKYLAETNHGVNVNYHLASKKWFDKLPADLQKICVEVDIEAEKETFRLAQEIDQKARDAMKAAGLKFTTISPQERERFRKATESVKNFYTERLGDTGKKLLEMLEADIAAFSK